MVKSANLAVVMDLLPLLCALGETRLSSSPAHHILQYNINICCAKTRRLLVSK